MAAAGGRADKQPGPGREATRDIHGSAPPWLRLRHALPQHPPCLSLSLLPRHNNRQTRSLHRHGFASLAIVLLPSTANIKKKKHSPSQTPAEPLLRGLAITDVSYGIYEYRALIRLKKYDISSIQRFPPDTSVRLAELHTGWGAQRVRWTRATDAASPQPKQGQVNLSDDAGCTTASKFSTCNLQSCK